MKKKRPSAGERTMVAVIEAMLRGFSLVDSPPGQGDTLELVNESRDTLLLAPPRALVRQMADNGYIRSESGRQFGPDEILSWDVMFDWYVTSKGYGLYLASRGLE